MSGPDVDLEPGTGLFADFRGWSGIRRRGRSRLSSRGRSSSEQSARARYAARVGCLRLGRKDARLLWLGQDGSYLGCGPRATGVGPADRELAGLVASFLREPES